MVDNGSIFFARAGENYEEKLYLLPRMANRHGFICGATGTGKTITLKVLAESFSDIGVPVFLSDVKGDLGGMLKPGEDSENMQKRIAKYGLAECGFGYKGYPTQFYDIFGEKGIPLRATISEIGPQIMAQILELNDTQTDVLSVVYKIADDHNLLLVDTKDLKACLQFASENASEFELQYGRMAKASLTAIVRAVVALESQGGDLFFGEPALNINDFFQTDYSGRGLINVLDSQTLINKPKMYSSFMLYLMSELFEDLPEIGDPEKPRMVFFFDEAHLLFKNASKSLMSKIEQMIKLIRSKGVGVFFVTQSPGDIPSDIMAQLGNKIEHALRAYTPTEMKAVKTAAAAFRTNPAFDTEELITQLGTGEAVVSMLDEKGVPRVAEHAYILPPQSLMGGIDDGERDRAVKSSMLYNKYITPTDPDSAYEFLLRRRQQQATEIEQMKAEAEARKAAEKAEKEAQKEAEKAAKEAERAEARKKKQTQTAVKSVGKTVTGTIGREVGKTIGGTFGGTFGKQLGANLGGSLGRNLFGTLFKS